MGFWVGPNVKKLSIKPGRVSEVVGRWNRHWIMPYKLPLWCYYEGAIARNIINW